MVSQVFTSVAGMGAIAMAFAALTVPFLYIFMAFEGLFSFLPDFPDPASPSSASFASSNYKASVFTCEPSGYRTEIISLDPLLIYIHSFIREVEIESLLAVADPLLNPFEVSETNQKMGTSDLTPSSAELPLQDDTVQCVLTRARQFMGARMVEGRDDIGPPQLVRYTAGQTSYARRDWYDEPQWIFDGSWKKFNRVASFFVTLQDNCTGGEIHIPYVGPKAPEHSDEKDVHDVTHPTIWTTSDPFFQEYSHGGLAFRPVRGNALFLVNLQPDGLGDERTMHANLPVGEGVNTVMNIWPRRFIPMG